GGMVDNVMQRFAEILNGIPTLVIVTLLGMVLPAGITSIIFALMLTGWIGMERIARAQVLKVKEQEFVLASRTLGASKFKIIFSEILPNILGQVIVTSMFSIPNAIFLEAYLSFLGLGVPAPMASLGSLVSDGYKSMTTFPHILAIPVIVMAVLMLCFNLFADGLRDAFDPKMINK
ncbi:MAG: ABC transporter permease, partial [Erysipelotrichaceae bacterium]|nr:ABC transporter permease [Erysipelotrichaceae bacterium]